MQVIDPGVKYLFANDEVKVACSRLREAQNIMADVTDKKFQKFRAQVTKALRILTQC